MLHGYVEVEAGLLVLQDVLPDLTGIDTAIFDVDGVLIDVSQSYPVVVIEAAQFYFERILGWPAGMGDSNDEARLVDRRDISLFKQTGGFNSDWAVAQAAVLYYLWKAGRTGLRDLAVLRSAEPSLESFLAEVRQAGGGLAAVERLAAPETVLPAPWDPALVERLCEEHYGGDDWCEEMFGYRPAYRIGWPGLFNLERPIIDPAELADWPGRAGIYTGRIDRETGPALKLCALDRFLGNVIPEGAVVTSSDGYAKPDPGGLRQAATATGARRAVFCGDNIDDWVTVANYRRSGSESPAEFIFAGILGGTLGPQAEAIFRERGAEIIARDVNMVLRYLKNTS